MGSELSPSESRATLEPADSGDGVEKGHEGSGSEGGANKQSVDQLLCGDGPEDEARPGLAPLVPSSTSDLNRKASVQENAGQDSSNEGGEAFGASDEVAVGSEPKTHTSDLFSDPLGSKDPCDGDKTAAGKMPQSMSRYSNAILFHSQHFNVKMLSIKCWSLMFLCLQTCTLILLIEQKT